MQKRHHSSHPPSAVKANPDINKKPNPVEQAALPAPNPNPSLGPVVSPRIDPVNARTPGVQYSATREDSTTLLPCDDDTDDGDDRKRPSTFAY